MKRVHQNSKGNDNMRISDKTFKMGTKAADKALKSVVNRPISNRKLKEYEEQMRIRAPHEVLNECNIIECIQLQRKMYSHCRTAQKLVLASIIRSARNTEFGRKYNFHKIHSVSDYRRMVPVTGFEDYKEGFERLMKGEADYSFPGKAVFFHQTSGSTGAFKYIPESAMEKEARKALTKIRYIEMVLNTSTAGLRRVFPFFNAADAQMTEGGIPAGAASGRTVNSTSKLLKRFFAYSPLVVEELTDEALYYTIMRLTMAHSDLSAFLGNNAHMLTIFVDCAKENAEDIIKDIRYGTNKYQLSKELQEEEREALRPNPKRADELLELYKSDRFIPRYYWKDIVVASFWLGGSVGIFVDEIKPLLPEDTIYFDVGYGSSEAKINIPLIPNTPAGALSIATSFFEFVPQSGGDTLLAHELEDGEIYEVLITTYGGLYRYRLKDYVKVDGFTGDTPNIYFVSKSTDVANLVQEKAPGSALLTAVRSVVEKDNLGFVGCQVYTDSKKLCYVVCVETKRRPKDEAEFTKAIDDAICRENRLYSMFRYQVPQINPCEVVFMKEGWWDRLVDKSRKGNSTAAQVKVPVVVLKMPED